MEACLSSDGDVLQSLPLPFDLDYPLVMDRFWDWALISEWLVIDWSIDFYAYSSECYRSIDDYHMIMGSFADFGKFSKFGNSFQSGIDLSDIHDLHDSYMTFSGSCNFLDH